MMMMRKLAVLFLSLGGILPLAADEASQRPVEKVHTETVNFAPGGVIRLIDTLGALNVEGWDRPQVEITVTKSRVRYADPKQRDAAALTLERFTVAAERKSDNELTISTASPHRRFPYWWSGQHGVMLDYAIHVPRNSKLEIHHRGGLVLVSNVTGDIDAVSSSGDIMLMLPDSGAYSIDAQSKLGAVTSDFVGDSRLRHLTTSTFARSTDASPFRRVHVRTGVGGITIKAVPVEAEAPVSRR
jgi:Putative adhesin